MLALIFAACQFFDKKTDEPNADKILNNPPFDMLTDSIRLLPGSALLHLERAQLLSQKGFHDLAYDDYKKSWELQPDENTALALAANMFMTGKSTEAIDFLEKCVRQYPANTEFKRRLSEAYMQTGNDKAALALYDEMLNTDSTDFEAWYEKGMLLLQAKDTAAAITALKKSYNLQPLQLSGIALANLYAETSNPAALAICDALLEKDIAKTLTDAVFIKGVYYTNIRQYARALEQFDNCIRRDWKFTDAYIEKGIILFQQKNIDEAMRTFRLAATVSNTYPDAYYWLGRCYEQLGKHEEARENYLSALALDKNFEEAKKGLARLRKK